MAGKLVAYPHGEATHGVRQRGKRNADLAIRWRRVYALPWCRSVEIANRYQTLTRSRFTSWISLRSIIAHLNRPRNTTQDERRIRSTQPNQLSCIRSDATNGLAANCTSAISPRRRSTRHDRRVLRLDGGRQRRRQHLRFTWAVLTFLRHGIPVSVRHFSG